MVSLPYLLRRDLGPYAEDRTPFQFLASQMICVALPSHLSCVPYARGVHPLISFIHHPAPPRALVSFLHVSGSAPVLAQPCSRSSGYCTCVGSVDRRSIAHDASAMEADSLLKFGYPFEWPAGGVGPGVVGNFSLIPPTYELRALCRGSYTLSVLGQANDLCSFTWSSELRALCKGGTPSHIFIYTQHPPGHFRTPHGTRLCIYTCGGPGLNPAYICWHVSGHVSTPGCVSRLGPERSIASLTFSFCRSTCTTPSTGLIE